MDFDLALDSEEKLHATHTSKGKVYRSRLYRSAEAGAGPRFAQNTRNQLVKIILLILISTFGSISIALLTNSPTVIV